MPSSEPTRQRAAGADAAAAAEATGRRNSRIIAAERLAGYAPFAMGELSGGPMSTFSGSRPFARSEAGDDTELPFPRFGADAEPDPIAQEGFDAGYRAGREAGLADGLKRGFEAGVNHADRQHRQAETQAGATLAARVEALCANLQASFAQVERVAADDVIALALDVARHALRATLAVRPEAIVAVVQEALGQLLEDRVRVHLHLHPGDAELVRAELGERLAAQNCEIVADSAIEPGGCLIRTPRAEVDATVQTRWRRTVAALGYGSDDPQAASTGGDA